MICDSGKVVSLRKAKLITQETLAARANVNRRTIQRLEAGKPVSTEVLHQVAAPLGVTAHDLLLDPDEPNEGLADRSAGILLKPESSGARLVEAIREANQLDFGVEFEPWPEQVEIVGPFLRFLEELNPHTFGDLRDYDSLSEASGRLQAAAKVNIGLARITEVKPEGLRILFGQYTVMGVRWRWDGEAMHWYTHSGMREEVLTVAALRIAPVSTPSLRVQIRGKPVPPPAPVEEADLDHNEISRAKRPSIVDELDDDVPF